MQPETSYHTTIQNLMLTLKRLQPAFSHIPIQLFSKSYYFPPLSLAEAAANAW